MLRTSQHITVTKSSHARHIPCCQTTPHSPKHCQKIHELDEAENTQIPPEVGLTHPVQLPTPWVNAVWKLPDLTRLKQKATCPENLQYMPGTSQHITVTKRSHERHSLCCPTTSQGPKQDQDIHDVDKAGNTQIPH